MTPSSLSKLLQYANDVREQDKLEESLSVADQIIIQAAKEKKYSILIEALHCKVLSLKHFYLLNKDPDFRTLAYESAKSAMKICQEQKIRQKLSVSYFRLGEMNMLFEDYTEAVNNYQKSLKFYGPENAEKGDYLYHLGEAIFRSNNISKGEKTILKGLNLLQKYQSKTDPFLIQVWISGCYLRLAELTHSINSQKSRNYFNLAKEIIDSDSRLIIRKRQISSLAKKLARK